ncbi:zeta toxin family protein [Paenarthrobacter sp. S56]|uniref:zeta toxin family protein n=1 Tax=Paenarthrobacter sp. S56 TaxID=3138179 RepID=UPI003219EAFB
MSDETLNEIFDREIVPFLFSDAEPEDHPRLYLVGGQPGAGKSAAMETVLRHAAERGQSCPVAVIGDELRIFHPAYGSLLETDPIHMPEATAASSGAWIRRSLDYARNRRISVAVEGTFRTPEVTLSTAEVFYEAGFFTCLIALAVPGPVSRLSTVDRFFRELQDGRLSRWTPHGAHDSGFDGTMFTVELAQSHLSVSSLTVMNRSGDILFSKSRDFGLSSWRDDQPLNGAADVLALERDKTWDPDFSLQWAKRLITNINWALVSEIPARAAVPVFVQLLDDVEKPVKALTHHHHSRTSTSLRQIIVRPGNVFRRAKMFLDRKRTADFPLNGLRRFQTNSLGLRSASGRRVWTLAQWTSAWPQWMEDGHDSLDAAFHIDSHHA